MAAQPVLRPTPEEDAPTALALLTIPGDTPEDSDTYWLREVYQADRVPQFTLRAVLLGLACLALVVSGTQLRLAAPFVYGAVVGLLVVLREAAPIIGETVPRWSLIGAAGVLLIGLGVTWEQRMLQARAAAAYVKRMR